MVINIRCNLNFKKYCTIKNRVGKIEVQTYFPGKFLGCQDNS